jgi:hypothetical protein
MTRPFTALALAFLSTTAVAAPVSSATNFGVRVVGKLPDGAPVAAPGAARIHLGEVARIGAQWGRVTSTYRSPAHNRAVGGVPNSYHLRGRAVDIARRAGVSHAQIAAAYRNAGYFLIESLDEGDHSHFAFGNPGMATRYLAGRVQTNSRWRVVYAPPGDSLVRPARLEVVSPPKIRSVPAGSSVPLGAAVAVVSSVKPAGN